jgi:hypothetical protein
MMIGKQQHHLGHWNPGHQYSYSSRPLKDGLIMDPESTQKKQNPEIKGDRSGVMVWEKGRTKGNK